jgi:hypothetical protein
VARARDYAREYRQRRAKYKGLPARVATGKGEVPAEIAYKAEHGTLTRDEARRWHHGLRAYEKRYGPAAHGKPHAKRPGVVHQVPESFRTRAEARRYMQTEYPDVPAAYREITKHQGRWIVLLKR